MLKSVFPYKDIVLIIRLSINFSQKLSISSVVIIFAPANLACGNKLYVFRCVRMHIAMSHVFILKNNVTSAFLFAIYIKRILC